MPVPRKPFCQVRGMGLKTPHQPQNISWRICCISYFLLDISCSIAEPLGWWGYLLSWTSICCLGAVYVSFAVWLRRNSAAFCLWKWLNDVLKSERRFCDSDFVISGGVRILWRWELCLGAGSLFYRFSFWKMIWLIVASVLEGLAFWISSCRDGVCMIVLRKSYMRTLDSLNSNLPWTSTLTLFLNPRLGPHFNHRLAPSLLLYLPLLSSTLHLALDLSPGWTHGCSFPSTLDHGSALDFDQTRGRSFQGRQIHLELTYLDPV